MTTLIPGPGPAAKIAAGLGDVITGGPAGLALPRRPEALRRELAAIRSGKQLISRTASRLGCDVVLATSSRIPAAVLGGRAAGAGVIVYAGEPRADRAATRLASAAVALAAGRQADAVIVPSPRSARWQSVLGPAPKVVTPIVKLDGLGPGLADRARALRESLGVPAKAPLVASLGAINYSRGQDLLIEALVRLAREDATVVIGGESLGYEADLRFEQHLRAMAAEKGLGERVVFAGAIADAAAFCAAADVFVNPARVDESFGRAACEALLAGTPVVSSRPGAGQGFLEHERSALLVKPNNPRAVAQAVERLLGDREFAAGLAAAGAGAVTRECALPAGQAQFELAIAEALAAVRQQTGR